MSTDEGTLTRFLESDMERIVTILAQIRPDTPRPARATFEEFERRLNLHLDWEESFVFPAAAAKLESIRPVAQQMREEHDDLRRLVAEARAALKDFNEKAAAERLKELSHALNDHELNESRELFPRLKAALDPHAMAALRERLPRY